MTLRKRYSVDLAALHVCCEANYWRCLRLMPALRQAATATDTQPAQLLISHNDGSRHRVSISVLERARFTSTLYFIEQPIEPDTTVPIGRNTEFTVQLYSDARMAEVVNYQGSEPVSPRYSYPNAQMHQPDEKAQWNQLFGEWLQYCLAHGHTEQWYYQP